MIRTLQQLLLLVAIFFCAPTANAESVEPLLDGWVRSQKDPFNRKCPLYIDHTGALTQYRCQVGCVATALETILSYHRREIVLHDMIPGWEGDRFKSDDILAGTRVDTRLILADYGDGTAASVGMSDEDYAASVDAVSTLSLICGMMAHMNWGIESSGADTERLVEPLLNNIGWKTAEYIDSYMYTPEQWREILKNELRHGRPILYTGYTMNIDGHAFVIDGFDDNDRFHINWGYGGAYDDGYYDITQLANFSPQHDVLPVDIQQGFFCNQQALIISPDEIDKTLIADSLQRTGKEIVVESMTVDESALTNKFTPVTIKVRNTAKIPLCSPFEIFTNSAYDTDIFRDGDYGALFGVNLEPGERRTITVACRFTKKGNRTMRISPDDVEVLSTKTVNIAEGKADNLEFSPVTAEFSRNPLDEAAGVDATFSVPVANRAGERSGSLVTYCLLDDAKMIDGDPRHFEYYYVPANSNTTKTFTFRGLVPGDEHVLAVRCPWTIRQSYTFTVPDVQVGVPETLTLAPADSTPLWYDLSGRRTDANAGGVLIHGGKKILR